MGGAAGRTRPGAVGVWDRLMDLKQRIAVVTGAGRRVGREIALGLASAGARLAVHYNSTDSGARAVVAEIRGSGGDAEVFQADLSQADAAVGLIDKVVQSMGGVDVLVNSAGIMERTPIGSVTPAMWDHIFAINLRAPFFLAQAVAPHMTGRGGAIVNIADLAGLEAWTAYVPHGISKAGIIQMTRALAHALAPRIRVNGVAPGPVLLPEHWDQAAADHLIATTPLKRLGDPSDVVGAVLYLLGADYVTGETIIVDGGRRVRT
jgi:pteridine reductase